MKPLPQPITGEEPLDELVRPEQALSQFYRAFNRRDLELMRANWLDAEEVSMDNPLGGIKRGWPDIESVYRAVFEGSARVQVEFHDYTLHTTDAFFYAVGRERGALIAPNGTRLELKIRTTRLFRKVENRWRQVHHHGSFDDPELLGQYQRLVLGRS